MTDDNLDSTRPHVGRIYDFILGGHHNFEADRKAAAEILKIVPIYPELARLNRWFLQLVAMRWADAGVQNLLDLGSGLPTQGHFNEHLPAARILFSDKDELSVSHGQKILQGSPHQRYLQADLMEPQPLFKSAAEFFGKGQQVAIGFIGISYLLPDEAVKQIAHLAHALCAPGSLMAVTGAEAMLKNSSENPSEMAAIAAQIARTIRAPVSLRTPEQLEKLIHPWHMNEQHRLEDWLDMKGFGAPKSKAADFNIEMYGMLATR